ncbi:MAG TPA: HAMP domain-containing protein [Caldilineae bacterium]|nr:HAMP domain-containing protein [Caldilineae bacterium]
MFSSLRARLLLSYLAVILVALSVAAVTFVLTVRPYQRRVILTQLRANLALAVPLVERLWSTGMAPDEIARVMREGRARLGTSGRALLLDARGNVLADTEGELVGEQFPHLAQRRALPRAPFTGELRIGDDERFFYAAARTRPQLLRPPLIVVLVAPVREARVLLSLGPQLLYAGGVALLLAIILAILIARSFARPLGVVAEAAEEIARGNLDLQLEIRRPAEMRRLVDSFNAMTREVKAARQAQRDFIANVSHDLKTPLTSIQGYAQALLDGTATTPEAQRQAASVIYEEATRMHRLVEQLLELARLDAGQIKMARVPVDLSGLLSSCVERQRLRSQEREITLTLNVPQGLSVVGDPDRLFQVFTNLLDNALSYTPAGGQVEVTAERVEEEDRPWIAVSVTDNGPGIPPEELPRLFERFYRVDKARRRGGGSGLGLAIVKELVEAHGGRVRAESVVGLGTRFTVLLPVQDASEGHAANPS